ncbi:MAG TPA: cytochrome c3 family protein [Anaeromyxobacteraceae bacterium]|nr:cytochrome c3 family protein [Anaeromyxobacteraceae bacterium]
MHALSTLRTLAPALLAAAALVSSSACQQRPAGQGTSAQAALVAGPTCSPGPTAHEKHIGMFSCDTCHPCGGVVGFDVVTSFPRGTTTAGGTVVRSTPTTPASCTVACHYPMGAPARAVTFTTPGPLLCTECHAVARLPGTHPAIADPAPTRAFCQGCHGTTGHMTGVIPTGACGSCHGLPPQNQPSPSHPVYRFAAPCVGCHPGSTTVDASGSNAILAGGQHQDGAVQYTFAGHADGWAVPGAGGGIGGLHSKQACLGCGSFPVPGYFTMGDYWAQCTGCHGNGFDFEPTGGTSRVSCGACHPAFFDPGGQVSCTFCH